MTPDQHRKAKTVIAWLAKAEDPEAKEYPIERVRAERWPEVCAAVEAHPDLSAASIAERLTPARDETAGKRPDPPAPAAAPSLPTYRAEPWRPVPPEVRRQAKERLAAIREAAGIPKKENAS